VATSGALPQPTIGVTAVFFAPPAPQGAYISEMP